ncbi:hypothetical protein ACXIUA_00325 [Corynebacterium sp. UMB8791]
MKKYLELNAQLNRLDAEGNLQVDKDREAAREYFVTMFRRLVTP